MRIYFIKLDAMPFCQEALDLVDIVKGTLLRNITSCFTTGTVNSMLTGKITSDLSPHGVGYHTWKEKVNSEGHVDFPWIEENILIDLMNRGFKFVSRNWGSILDQLGLTRFPQFRDQSSPYDEHDGHCWKFLTARGPEWIESRDNEFTWVDKTRSLKNKDVFYNINYSHFHAAIAKTTPEEHKQRCRIAGMNVLEILSHYDFTAPNTLFWIYSDHGPWEHPNLDWYPHPRHFYSFAVVRDNTLSPLEFPLKVVQAKDFKAYIQLKLGEIDVDIPRSKNRIFFGEDGRGPHGGDRMTTVWACNFKEWEDTYPSTMTYVVWNECHCKFLQTEVKFDKNGFTKDVNELEDVPDKDLVNALVERFDWVTK